MEDSFMDGKEHGFYVDKKKNRVKCNYCGKEVQGFRRLRIHLGGLGGDVTYCDQVTSNVRESFRSMVVKQQLNSAAAAKSKRVRKRGRIDIPSSKTVSPEEGATSSLVSNAVVYSPGFSEMMSECGGEIWLNIPGSHEAIKEVEEHVKKVKDSWAITGCSILLDAWVDHEKRRDLVTFIADSPAGPVYLKSFDVSDIKYDSNALISLVDELVDEVGVSNVIQIVACSTTGWVGELGEAYVGNNKKGIFWSVSVSHCFELMLLKIKEIDSHDHIVEAVNMITDYANSNPLVLKIVRDQDRSHGLDTDVSSEFEFFMPYLSVESIFRAKDELVAMFASSDWNREEEDATHVGHVYDTMDVIKESIAREFDNDKLCYMPLWDVIDDVWTKRLHSPLHAAGYFLNPTAFYSTDFYLDTEVATGLITSLVHIVKELDIQVKIATQLDVYKVREGCFNEASQGDQISGFSPAEWWAEKASQYPELQSFAIKILSQTCEGASKYKLNRSIAEKLLLTRGMGSCEKQHQEELAFVHYNLHLQSCKSTN
ncbi:HAT protein [Hirschfeldia incana]|nr:HAT protein [Hirschfeldia incana]